MTYKAISLGWGVQSFTMAAMDDHPAHPTIAALLAEVRRMRDPHTCEWGTTKCCGTCAYWDSIDTTIEKGVGKCGSNGIEWRKNEFCCDWVEKEQTEDTSSAIGI